MPQTAERRKQLRKENPEKYRAYDRARYAVNPEPKKTRAKIHRQENLDAVREKDRQRGPTRFAAAREKDPDYHKDAANRSNKKRYHRRKEMEPEALRLERYGYRLKARYKVNGQPMTLADYVTFLNKQDGHCALCSRTPEQERYGRLSVDHDYVTDEVRGLLCASCNTALGHFGDNEGGVLRLLAYVRGEL